MPSASEQGSLAGPGKGETVPAFVEKIASLEEERDPGDPGKTIRSVQLGRHEGTSVIVAEANANSPKKVATLRDAAAKIMAEEGVAAKDITTDCRVVNVERMLHEPEVIPR